MFARPTARRTAWPVRRPGARRGLAGAVPVEVAVVALALLAGAGLGYLLAAGPEAEAAKGGIVTIGGDADDDATPGTVDLVDDDASGPATDTDDGGRRAVADSRDVSDDELAALVGGDPLLAELRALLGDEALIASIATDEESTAAFLMHLYLGLGDAERAFHLCLRTNPVAGTWAQVAAMLHSQGQRGDAAEAYARALERAGRFAWQEPLSDWALQLSELDPERGLAFLEEHATGSAADPDTMRLAVARSMAETGREDEARDALLEMIALDRSVSASLDALAAFDPDLAESEMRRLIGEGQHPQLFGQLAAFLADAGRLDEALATVQEGFELASSGEPGGPDAGSLFYQALQSVGSQVDDATIGAWLDAADGGSGLKHTAGRHFLEAGDVDRAAPYFGAAWLQQAEHAGSLTGLPQAFVDAKPELVGAWLDEMSALAGNKDEVWGDIADHYWKVGDAEAAQAAYAKANEIDPNDSEWTGKLDKMASGNAPF